MEMQEKPQKQSIWKTEIHIPFDDLLARLPANFEERLAALCVGAFLISPLVVSLLCLKERCIDYTIYIHPDVIKNWIWPLSSLFGVLAMVLKAWEGQGDGSCVRIALT